MYKIGDRVMVAEDNDNEGYDGFRGKVLIVANIYTNTEEHKGYDNSMEGMQLLEFITEDGQEVDSALYEYEIEEA